MPHRSLFQHLQATTPFPSHQQPGSTDKTHTTHRTHTHTAQTHRQRKKKLMYTSLHWSSSAALCHHPPLCTKQFLLSPLSKTIDFAVLAAFSVGLELSNCTENGVKDHSGQRVTGVICSLNGTPLKRILETDNSIYPFSPSHVKGFSNVSNVFKTQMHTAKVITADLSLKLFSHSSCKLFYICGFPFCRKIKLSDRKQQAYK